MLEKLNTEGVKLDQGKPALELLPPSYWLYVISSHSSAMSEWYFNHERLPECLPYDPVLVLEYGAKKYRLHNWFLGMRWGRLVGAFHRHINKYNEERKLWVPRDLKEIDEESGLPHGAHAECCRLFLAEYYYNFTIKKKLIGENDCAWNREEKE